jgi:thiaminase
MELESLWRAATQHPFLNQVRVAGIAESAFDRWLIQDALFVTDLLAFQARLLARAPRPAQTVLAGGCLALAEELDWFQVQAARRGLDLAQPPLPETLAYRALLGELEARPYDDAVTALWVLEQVYLLAWSTVGAAGISGKYQLFVEHWTALGFESYVGALEVLASPAGRDDLIRTVLEREIDFGQMALT